VNEFEGEGVAIALLIGADESSIVGWVYRWPRGALAVRWDIKGPQAVSRTEPELSDEELKELRFDLLQRIRGPRWKSGGS